VRALWLLGAVMAITSCSKSERLEEPLEVEEQRRVVQESVLFRKVAPTNPLVLAFVGCYEVDLGTAFRRPSSWPQHITFELKAIQSENPFDLVAASPLSAPRSPTWRVQNSSSVIVDWREEDNSLFQILLVRRGAAFSASSTSKIFPAEAASVTRAKC
jgi:hypothetical protein